MSAEKAIRARAQWLLTARDALTSHDAVFLEHILSAVVVTEALMAAREERP
jgi:hypothetical protein